MAEETVPVSKREYELLAAFRFALRSFQTFSEGAAAAAGLTPQQHQALLAIKGYPGKDRVTITELANRLSIKHHSAVGLVDRMEALGMVERQWSEDDRRHVFVVLSGRAVGLMANLASTHRDELRRIGPQLRRLLREVEGCEEPGGSPPGQGSRMGDPLRSPGEGKRSE